MSVRPLRNRLPWGVPIVPRGSELKVKNVSKTRNVKVPKMERTQKLVPFLWSLTISWNDGTYGSRVAPTDSTKSNTIIVTNQKKRKPFVPSLSLFRETPPVLRRRVWYKKRPETIYLQWDLYTNVGGFQGPTNRRKVLLRSVNTSPTPIPTPLVFKCLVVVSFYRIFDRSNHNI